MRTLLLWLTLAACYPAPPDFQPHYLPSAHNPNPPYQIMDSLMADRHNITPGLAHQISTAARHHQVPYFLAFSLVRVESDFHPQAVSHAGAIGLTQVMPPTGRAHCDLSPDSLFLPVPNLHCGFSYLRMLHDRLHSWPLALASYNVGDARRRRAHRTGEPDGSKYAHAVLSRLMN